MTTPEKFEQTLQQQYQHDKAMHVQPEHVSTNIIKHAKCRALSPWNGFWRKTQLVLSCALIVLTGYLLLPTSPASPKLYYQIVVSTDTHYREVQQHRITSQPDPDSTARSSQTVVAYQQYNVVQDRSKAFYAQIGLLSQNDEQWQITVCDDLLLTIDRQLLSQLSSAQQFKDYKQAQWIEFFSNQAGQLVAIKPVTSVLQCPHS